jgi:chromosome segregation ATPase
MAKPQGYYTEDVEQFIDVTVRESVVAYQNEISSQAKNIDSLEERVNQLNSRIAELELKDSFASASNNMETDDALMASLEKQEAMELEVSSLKTKVASLESELATKENYAQELNDYIDALQPILEQGAAAIATLEQAGSAVAPEEEAQGLNPDVVSEDLTSYDSDEDEVISKRNKIEKKKPAKEVQDFSSVTVSETVVDANSIEFDMTPEVDMDMLNEEMMNSGVDGEEDAGDNQTLPDGTVLPKGVRPEDL